MQLNITTDLIEKAEIHIREEFLGEGTGHDWFHIDRVRRSALSIAKTEGGDLAMVEIIALLHDLGDRKLHNGDDTMAPRLIREFLMNSGMTPEGASFLVDEIQAISYKGESGETKPNSLEGRIVQDADRLDALGAIGIARAFAYGGARNRPIYDPNEPPALNMDDQAYKKNKGHTINHFYEKLLLLHDRMNTEAGRLMANERQQFMVDFLERFFVEWEGKA